MPPASSPTRCASSPIPAASGMIEPSQGIHLVFERSFLRGDAAIMVPHTSDGRVLFAIPWHGHTLVGTTDTPIEQPSYDPLPLEQEIDFILETAERYLSRPPRARGYPQRLCRHSPAGQSRRTDSGKTSSLSRDHTIHIDNSGLLTIAGGKWTTYRHMAEDCVDHAITLGRLDEKPCVTRNLHIHGYREETDELGHLAFMAAMRKQYRPSRPGMLRLPSRSIRHCHTSRAEVVWAAREEMARTVDDVISRRTRALFLNASAAQRMIAPVASLLARELGRDDAWRRRQIEAASATAAKYVVSDPIAET